MFPASSFARLEHSQHAVGDKKSADDVARRADDRDESQDRGNGIPVGAGGDQ